MDALNYYIRFYDRGRFKWAESIPSFSKLISIASALDTYTYNCARSTTQLRISRDNGQPDKTSTLVELYIVATAEDSVRATIKNVLLGR